MSAVFPKIEKKEFAERLLRLRGKMKEKEIDLVMVFSNLLDPSAVRYFTDFAGVNESAALIVPADGRAVLCSGQASSDYAAMQNALEEAEIKVFPEIGEVSGFEYDFEGQLDFAEFFKELKSKYKVRRIGVIGRLIFPAIIYNKLSGVFSEAKIVDFDDELYELRLIKSEGEIACMKKSAEIISETFSNTVPRIRVGMTEREIQAMFESEMLRLGGESYVQAFAPMVATGPIRSHISMCRNSLRQVEEGEMLNLAAGVCYEGYNGIICSPYVLGKIPSEILSAVSCAYDALNFASEKMRAGTPCDIVLNAYTEYLSEKGYLQYCPYGSLHSTGMLECEAPIFSTKNKRVIEENMTICIDAYFKGLPWGSFRIEDVYVIGKNGAERITTYNDAFLPKFLNRK